MPAFDLSAIRAKVKTTLEGVGDIAFVYDHHRTELEGYPSVTFDISNNANAFLTNRDNLRAIDFQIVIYQETEIKKLDSATDILDTVAQAIINAFEADLTLGGQVHWCDPLIGARNQLETPQGLVVSQQLTLKCNVAVLA